MRDVFARLWWTLRWLVDGFLHGDTQPVTLVWRASSRYVEMMRAGQFRRLT